MTAHPSQRKSGFAGLRLVPHPAEGQPGPVPFTVQILVVDGRVSIEWDPKTPDAVEALTEVVDVIAAACAALRGDQDVDGRIQGAYDRTRRWREVAHAKELEYERTHPWKCACGQRAKTESGLNTHRRAGGPRCG